MADIKLMAPGQRAELDEWMTEGNAVCAGFRSAANRCVSPPANPMLSYTR